MPPVFEERASAKINLMLRVLGRRSDGYHEIESLVAFATFGDRITLHPDDPPRLALAGPFASAIDGPNLVQAAARRAQDADPSLSVGRIVLEKNLPVAAGLGGGSADAAATLRAIARANPGRAAAIDWRGMAAALGADVPVCLLQRPAIMRGIGERVVPLDHLPRTFIVLANPGIPLATRDVFAALGARPAQAEALTASAAPTFRDVHALRKWLQGHGNDLEAPALLLCPAIARVKAALGSQTGALLARMSGSGPTCFALFADEAAARAAAASITRREPGWWVVATESAGPPSAL